VDFIVLSSSRGTTFQAVIDAMQGGALQARCLGLIADREDRGCVEKARAANIPVAIVERVKGEEREVYDRRVQEGIIELWKAAYGESCQLSAVSCQLVLACMGWMLLFSPWFVEMWRNRILNVHPSLLPKFPGAHAVDDALRAGETETGMTIHWIDRGLDTGKIVVQKKCSIKADDTLDSLKERIQALEKEWYPKVLQGLHDGSMFLAQ